MDPEGAVEGQTAQLSRRVLLQRTAAVAAAASFPGVLAACGSSGAPAASSATPAAGKPRRDRHALAVEHADLFERCAGQPGL